MANLPLTFACGLYDRMLPLYTGAVKVEGVDLNFLAIDDPRQIFDRMAANTEFDACEMSSSEYISRFAARQCPFVALPVFPSRVFRHSFIAVNRNSGIRAPQDLAGKRIGVPLYTMTAAVFIRGLLEHDYGVDLSGVHWVQGAMNEPGGHGHPTVLPLLKQIRIEDNRSGRSLSDLIDAGELDATIGTSVPVAMKRNPAIERLFPDFRAAEKDYYRRTRIFPIMHLVVLRRDVHERNPWVAAALYRALCEAKDKALQRMRWGGALRYMLPWMLDDIREIDEVFGGDPWPYGVAANRPTLEALVTYLVEQSLIPSPIPIEQLFVAQ